MMFFFFPKNFFNYFFFLNVCFNLCLRLFCFLFLFFYLKLFKNLLFSFSPVTCYLFTFALTFLPFYLFYLVPLTSHLLPSFFLDLFFLTCVVSFVSAFFRCFTISFSCSLLFHFLFFEKKKLLYLFVGTFFF